MPKIIYPTASGTLESRGDRFGPRNYGDKFHDGVDIVKGRGYQWLAPFDGEVVFSGDSGPKFGWCAVVSARILDRRVEALVAHCLADTVPGLGPIKQGDPFGKCGLTGDTIGYHGHFQICVNGYWFTDLGAVDPESFIPSVNAESAALDIAQFPASVRRDLTKAGQHMMYLGEIGSGRVAAIPEGGSPYVFKSAAEYEAWRSIVATYNSMPDTPPQNILVVPPVLDQKKLLFVYPDKFSMAVEIQS